MKARLLLASATFLISACATTPKEVSKVTLSPLYQPTWSTPYGAPPFQDIDDKEYRGAFDQGMQRHIEEIEAIATSTEPATFANTIEAMERTGELLSRVGSVFFNLAGTDSNEVRQSIRSDYAPKLSQHRDRINLNDELWKRVKAVKESDAAKNLESDQQKLLTEYYKGFIRAGANLSSEKKKRLTEINAKLATNFAQFGDNIRKENERYVLFVDKKENLSGLPETVVSAAAATAKRKGQEGKWAFTLVRSSVTPFLQYADNRELRRQIYEAYTTRGQKNDEVDTQKIILETVKLRAERAELLGFKSHAHYNVDKNVAKTPEAVLKLLGQLWDGAVSIAKTEREALNEMLQGELGASETLKPWDWWYYAEKVRKAKFDLSEDELKPYFQVDAVREGAFSVASKLFGIRFEEVTHKVPTYHEEVKAFDVMNADGSHVGLLYVDYHPRDGKRGGAWMNAFREQNSLDGEVRPIIVNVGNFPAPSDDKPALLGWDEVNTLFHEFGHALHGLLSQVRYERLAGTNVKWDYVEFPSQLLENWAAEPAVIKEYARHYETNAPISDELIEKIEKASKFNQGFKMTELVGAALLDFHWHQLSLEEANQVSDVKAFEKAAIKKIGFIEEIAPRYHSTYFQHIFSGDSYSAGYYVYLWAQVLEADAYRAFQDAGNIFHPDLAKKLRKFVFSAGGSDDEMKLYESFRGQPVSPLPLLEKIGLGAKE
ncbi:MAG: M3 family metallopeptidase [Myxococcota bacterium]|nr:M3 family metallopeptidase [Myxococcota bacterium]